MNDSEFFEWYNFKATQEEKTVYDKMKRFEELFKDMVFASGTETSQFLECMICNQINSNSVEWEKACIDIPEEIEYFEPTNNGVKVSLLEIGHAQYDRDTKEITISPEFVDNDSTILHEMIHAYEDMLESQISFYRDAVLFSLYSRLSKRIPDLEEIIITHANIANQQILNKYGGVHDVLFILKSFDLDIKQGYQLGTVFGYGLKEELSQYQY